MRTDITLYMDEFRKTAEELGFTVNCSYITINNEFALTFYNQSSDTTTNNLTTIVKLSGIIEDNALIIKYPYMFKNPEAPILYLICEYYFSIAKLLELPKVQLSRKYFTNQQFPDIKNIITTFIAIGFERHVHNEWEISTDSGFKLISFIKEIMCSLHRINKDEILFNSKMSVPTIWIQKRRQQFSFDKTFLEVEITWDGSIRKGFISSRGEEILLEHDDQEIKLDSGYIYNVLTDLMETISEAQKLKNLISPPIINVFGFLGRALEKPSLNELNLEDASRELMDSYIALGFTYMDVEREAANYLNKPQPYGKKIKNIKDVYIFEFLNKHVVFMKVNERFTFHLVNDYNEAVEYVLQQLKLYLLKL